MKYLACIDPLFAGYIFFNICNYYPFLRAFRFLVDPEFEQHPIRRASPINIAATSSLLISTRFFHSRGNNFLQCNAESQHGSKFTATHTSLSKI